MRTLTLSRLGLLAFVFGLSANLLQAAPLRGWYTDWNAATCAAREKGVALIAIFAHERCPQCQKMDRALATRQVRDALSKAIKVHLEYSDNAALAAQMEVRVTPTLLVFSPDTGFDLCIYREEGAMTPRSLARIAQTAGLLSAGIQAKPSTRKTARKTETPKEKPEPASTPAPTPAVADAPAPAPAAASAPVPTNTKARPVARKARVARSTPCPVSSKSVEAPVQKSRGFFSTRVEAPTTGHTYYYGYNGAHE